MLSDNARRPDGRSRQVAFACTPDHVLFVAACIAQPKRVEAVARSVGKEYVYMQASSRCMDYRRLQCARWRCRS